MPAENKTSEQAPPPIYIVSGGRGLAANHVVQVVLAQFPHNKIPVLIIPDILGQQKITETVQNAKASKGIIVHTLVDRKLRQLLQAECEANNVPNIDLVSNLEYYLTELLQCCPLSQPGLYRKLKQDYFDRIDALEFTVSSDDGLNIHKLSNADIILTGVSRTGKTPLSMYLTMFGWKVANVPIIKDLQPPEGLFKVDRNRVIALTISCDQLAAHRSKRAKVMNSPATLDYVNPAQIKEELDYALSIFRKGGFTQINVTEKPIETTANEIVKLITDRFPLESRKH